MSDERNHPDAADHLGQAAGGITGVLAGAAIGTMAGPVGVLLGGIAGAIGGWWSGRAIAEAAEDLTESEETYYQDHVRRAGNRDADEAEVKGAFYLGHIAAANPAYADRRFDEVEPELERGWRNSDTTRTDWRAVRDRCRDGFTRGRERRSQRRDASERRINRPGSA